MNKTESKDFSKRAFICHLIFAVCIGLLLALNIHLDLINAGGDVIGSALFLFIMWLGLPVFVLFVLLIYYTYKARNDDKVIFLTTLLTVLILQWYVELEPVITISIVLESVYIILAFTFSLNSVYRIKKEVSKK